MGCCVVGNSGIVWFCGRKKKENRGITIAILWLDSFEGEGWWWISRDCAMYLFFALYRTWVRYCTSTGANNTSLAQYNSPSVLFRKNNVRFYAGIVTTNCAFGLYTYIAHPTSSPYCSCSNQLP